MRIVSKYKDYYDWVVFETDNRKIYNRKQDQKEPKEDIRNDYFPISNGYIGTLYFCNKKYTFLFWKEKYYWDSSKISDQLYDEISKIYQSNFRFTYNSSCAWNYFRIKQLGLAHEFKGGWKKDGITDKVIDTKINIKHDCPIALSFNSIQIITNPKLADIGFNKVMSAQQVYQEIYNWIPFIEPELPGSPDNMDRYEAKGFDKKTSFRPKMKNG